MTNLQGYDRIKFFYYQGIRYALSGSIGFGNYRDFSDAWKHFTEFKPFRPVEIGENEFDYVIFGQGFKFGKRRLIALQKIKLAAEAECKALIADVEKLAAANALREKIGVSGWGQ